MSIKLENVFFSYRKDTPDVIEDISLTIKEGSINVLLGLNGCGKTTLIKLLAGMVYPDKGTIKYDDVDLKEIPILERSKIFAYVSQKGVRADDFRVIDYLSYGVANSLKFYQSPKKEQIELIKNMAEKFKITHLLNKNIGEISGGEKQIVSIVSALVQNTPIIILDEPTSALDLANQSLVLSSLKDIASDGKTIILSSHNPNQALYLDANVILMDKGRIIDIGNSKRIVNKDKLKEIYGTKLVYSMELDYNEISYK